MAKEGYSLDVGATIENQTKADDRLEKQQKSQEKSHEEKPKEHKPHKQEKNWTRKNEIILVLVLLAIIITAGTYVRVFSLSAPAIDVLVDKTFEDSMRKAVTDKLTKGHVGPMDPRFLQTEVEKQLKEVLSHPDAEKEKQKMINEYKDVYYDDNGIPYLIGFDPYLYLRFARNIIRHGHPGETLKNSRPYDTLRRAPHGLAVPKGMLPYYEAFLYKIMKVFDRDTTIEKAAVYLPIVMGALSAILVFFIVRRLTNNYGGFLAGMLFMLHPITFSNTIAVDTQVPSVLYTLLIVWLAIEIIHAGKASLKTGLLSAALVAAVWLYKQSWSGYYYILAIMISFAVLYVILLLGKKYLSKDKLAKKHIYTALAVFAAGILFYLLKPGIINHVLSRLRLGDKTGLFSTGYFMISELQSITIKELIYKMGGPAVSIAALICVIYLIYKSYKLKFEGNSKYYLFIAYWFIGLSIIALMAQRFTLYFSIPFVLSIGAGAGFLYPLLGKIPKAVGMESRKKQIKIGIAIILVLLLIFVIKTSLKPRMYALSSTADDAFYKACIDIKEASSKDAIINSWWDDGYLLQYYAERPTLSDGGTFSSKRMYWMSKAFLSNDYNYSINVLRMLDCGNKAYNSIAKQKGPIKAINILNKILKAGKENSTEIIKEHGLDEKIIDSVFCEDVPEAYFFVRKNFVQKLNVFETIANRDLEAGQAGMKIKGMNAQEAVRFLEKEYNLSIDNAYDLYGRIQSIEEIGEAKIQFYDFTCRPVTETFMICGAGQITLNLTSKTAKSDSGEAFPWYLATEKNLVERLDVDNDVSLYFYQEKDVIRVASVKSEVRDSFLFQTYFLYAHEVPQLELISHTSAVLGTKNKAYRINW